MAPKFSQALGFREREQLNKNPSILAYTGDLGEDYLDPGDGWGEKAPCPAPHCRSSSGAAKPAAPAASWSSRFTTLSSSLYGARAALSKKLHVRESTRWAVSQLRKSVAEGSSSSAEWSKRRTASMPTPPRTGEAEFDHIGADDDNNAFMYAEVGPERDVDDKARTSTVRRLSKLLPSRSWTQGASKQKQSS
ncbi:hypothetical protein PHYBOEH_007502 [Phytophthora boehmeriae]|uniref:Uncharacterized protein n=1 Tax=Phytophthora boehmeriae TaxID=109152 RepID=A0A8T1WBI3_9STRA|nr:hypothetical protein PHYBOEH_007502 [Phytophthora boehmeriae]